jgi:EAL domain-containing protein (putative c-di-GMP-specific phosphodiesterase class I)
VIDDDGTCRRSIRALRRLCVCFALIDVGTGFPRSAGHKLDVDRIKIDKCFIDQVGDGGSNEAIVQAMALKGSDIVR